MKLTQVISLCDIYNIGDMVGETQEVTGGFVHRLWRLHTTHGSYAIKQLNPAIMQYPNIYETYRTSERIAAAMYAVGIPAVVALEGNDNDTLHIIDDDAFQVYRWIDGTTLSSQTVDPERARLIGNTLARMHALNQSFPKLIAPDWEPFSDDEWDMITFQAADRGLPWAQRVRNALPRIAEWSQWEAQAGETLEKMLVVSHRNLDQKDVLWQDAETFAILDWESAGLINPAMELVGAAFSWSGLMRGMPGERTFHALLEGYVASGGIIREAGLTAIHGVIGNWLDWLHFNMLRSFTDLEQERRVSESETLQTLTLLYALANNAETWASWVEKYR